MNKGKRWTEEEVEFLHDNYLHMTDEELGDVLGRTALAVKMKRHKERLVNEQNQHSWTTAETNYLREYHKIYSSRTLAERLNLPLDKVQSKLKTLGLRATLHDLVNADIEPFDIYKCRPHNTIYALYVGDKYVTDGTAEYLGKFLGVSAKTVKWYASPSAKRTDYSAKIIRLGRVKEFM